jgi:hypothetical protein
MAPTLYTLMTKELLQVNFNFSISRSDYEKAGAQMAAPISMVSGLIWKVWAIDEGRKEAAGIYLFDDKTSAQKYLAGEIFTAIKSNPALSNLSTKLFDVQDDLTRTTRGPLQLVHA